MFKASAKIRHAAGKTKNKKKVANNYFSIKTQHCIITLIIIMLCNSHMLLCIISQFYIKTQSIQSIRNRKKCIITGSVCFESWFT